MIKLLDYVHFTAYKTNIGEEEIYCLQRLAREENKTNIYSIEGKNLDELLKKCGGDKGFWFKQGTDNVRFITIPSPEIISSPNELLIRDRVNADELARIYAACKR